MSRYYDRIGKPIDLFKWARLMEDTSYRTLKRTQVSDIIVSTVWLGLNHRFGEGPPLIFETMTFSDRPNFEQAQERYETEQEALEGHRRMVEGQVLRYE